MPETRKEPVKVTVYDTDGKPRLVSPNNASDLIRFDGYTESKVVITYGSDSKQEAEPEVKLVAEPEVEHVVGSGQPVEEKSVSDLYKEAQELYPNYKFKWSPSRPHILRQIEEAKENE